MFIVWNPPELSRLYNLHPWYCNSLLYRLISSGENSAHFLQLMPFTIFQFFVPPGTHHCWVGRGSMEWEVCLTLLLMTSTGNRTPDLLILSLMPYSLGHMPYPFYTYLTFFSHSPDLSVLFSLCCPLGIYGICLLKQGSCMKCYVVHTYE